MEKNHQEKMAEIRKKKAEREERKRLGIPTPPPSEPSSDSEESSNDDEEDMKAVDIEPKQLSENTTTTVKSEDNTLSCETDSSGIVSDTKENANEQDDEDDPFANLDDDERAAIQSCPFVALRLTELDPGQTVQSVLHQMVADIDENDHPSSSSLVQLRKRLIKENRLPSKTKKSSLRDRNDPSSWEKQLEASKSFLNRPAIEAFRNDNYERAAELWERTVRSFDCVLYGKSFEMDEVQREDLHNFLNQTRCNVALAHIHLGNNKDAILHCSKALADNHKLPKAYYRKAQAELADNNITHALRTLDTMLEVFPSHKAALSLKARIKMEIKEQSMGTTKLMKGSLQKVFKRNQEAYEEEKQAKLWQNVKLGFDEGPKELICALYDLLRYKMCSNRRAKVE